MDRIPKVWPGWEAEELIGEGSFGRVYRASRSAGGVTTRAAIKVIDIPRSDAEVADLRQMGMDAPSIRSFFEDTANSVMREVALMERLKGAPGVVHVEDFQMLEREGSVGWTVLIRMELLESLPSVLGREGAPSPEQAARIASNVCAGLEACHREGVIHRDVKPANVFRGRFGDYRLGDFGLARRIQEGSRSARSYAGTEAYMAPEVPSGRYGPLVDVYSLGVMLYRWLNGGRPPFLEPSGTPSRADVERAGTRRMTGERPPAPAGAGVDPTLAAIALRAVEPDPTDRWQSAGELREALSGWLAGEAPAFSGRRDGAGDRHVIGLRSDGTAVAAGNNDDEQRDNSRWSGLIIPPEHLTPSFAVPDQSQIENAVSELKSSWRQLVQSATWASDAPLNSVPRNTVDVAKSNASTLSKMSYANMPPNKQEGLRGVVKAASLIETLFSLSGDDAYERAVEISLALDTALPSKHSIGESPSGKNDISNARLEIIGDTGLPRPSDMRYTGKPLKPKVAAWVIDPRSKSEMRLREGIDYTLYFEDNIGPSAQGESEAWVFIRGNGSYRGSKGAMFRIVRDGKGSGFDGSRPQTMRIFARKACDEYLRKSTIRGAFKDSQRIRRGLGIPANELVYLVHDDSLLKNGASGFAITEKGLYCRNSRGKADFMDWHSMAWTWNAESASLDASNISIGGKAVVYISGLYRDYAAAHDLLELYKKLVEHAMELRDAGYV